MGRNGHRAAGGYPVSRPAEAVEGSRLRATLAATTLKPAPRLLMQPPTTMSILTSADR